MMQSVAQAPWLESGEAVFEIPGGPPVSPWVKTCEQPACGCRDALVVATGEGHDVLRDEAAAARAERQSGLGRATVPGGAGRAGTRRFVLDIDRATALRGTGIGDGRDLVDAGDDPAIAALVRRIDGETLDGIGRLWYRGKGRRDREQEVLLTVEKIRRAREAGMIGWRDLKLDVRDDIYDFGGDVYRADEFYCPNPDCDCGEVVIDLEALAPRGAKTPGHIQMPLSGEAELVPERPEAMAVTERLWAAFRDRHPARTIRFAQRLDVMRTLSARMVVVPPAEATVGRNDPCLCGSGRKYKKCCGAPSP